MCAIKVLLDTKSTLFKVRYEKNEIFLIIKKVKTPKRKDRIVIILSVASSLHSEFKKSKFTFYSIYSQILYISAVEY